MISIPRLEADGMENWGLVTYKQRHLNIVKNTSFESKLQATLTISHEIAHQVLKHNFLNIEKA